LPEDGSAARPFTAFTSALDCPEANRCGSSTTLTMDARPGSAAAASRTDRAASGSVTPTMMSREPSARAAASAPPSTR